MKTTLSNCNDEIIINDETIRQYKLLKNKQAVQKYQSRPDIIAKKKNYNLNRYKNYLEIKEKNRL